MLLDILTGKKLNLFSTGHHTQKPTIISGLKQWIWEIKL